MWPNPGAPLPCLALPFFAFIPHGLHALLEQWQGMAWHGTAWHEHRLSPTGHFTEVLLNCSGWVSLPFVQPRLTFPLGPHYRRCTASCPVTRHSLFLRPPPTRIASRGGPFSIAVHLKLRPVEPTSVGYSSLAWLSGAGQRKT